MIVWAEISAQFYCKYCCHSKDRVEPSSTIWSYWGSFFRGNGLSIAAIFTYTTELRQVVAFSIIYFDFGTVFRSVQIIKISNYPNLNLLCPMLSYLAAYYKWIDWFVTKWIHYFFNCAKCKKRDESCKGRELWVWGTCEASSTTVAKDFILKTVE